MKQEYKVEFLNTCINELQQQTCAQRLELEDAHFGYAESRREQARLSGRIGSTRKSTSRYSYPKYPWSGRIEESSGIASWRTLCSKIERNAWDNTEARFTNTGVAREGELHEWFRRISSDGRTEVQWKVFSRSQSTGSRAAKSSICVEPRPKHAIWHMEFVWNTGRTFGKNWRSMFDSQGILHSTTPSATGAIQEVQGDLSREVKNELGAQHVPSRAQIPLSREFFTLRIQVPQVRLQCRQVQSDTFARGEERIGSTTPMPMYWQKGRQPWYSELTRGSSTDI